jgi:hypothetical protein
MAIEIDEKDLGYTLSKALMIRVYSIKNFDNKTTKK